jgi:multidrug efflux system membrane fusion protein
LVTSEKKPRVLRVVLVVLLLIGGGALLWRVSEPGNSASAARAQAHAAAVPVTATTVTKSDFPVYLEGLGTVQPYDTVTVRSRVDGQVTKVAFHQGQMIKQGDLLVQIDPRPYQAALDQAKAKKAQDEATLRNAKLDLQRAVVLAKQQAGPTQQVDTQKALVDQLTAQIQGDQATIDNAQTQLSYTTIRSPLTGKVGFRQVDPGNIVHAADTAGIVTIVKLRPISVVFTAPEEDVQRINKALAAGTVGVTASSSDGSRVLAQGHLAIVNNQVDAATGTIQMKATFANTDDALWPGLSVLTRLHVDTLKDVVVVPNEAIQHGPNGLFVFTINNQNKVAMRPVKTGAEGDTTTEIASGLDPGDRIVVAGQYRLTPGTLVAAKEQPPAAAPVAPPSTAQQDGQGLSEGKASGIERQANDAPPPREP